MHSRRTTTVSHTAVCAMVDLGKQPARWPCLLRLLRPLASRPYDVELPRSTSVARPAVHRNHLAPPARHRGPNSAKTPPVSHPGSARPRSCCRYVGNHSRREHCLHQSTNITFPRRLTAPRSMAGGSLVDPRPSRPSSSMGRRPSDGSWSLALADAWRCPASAKASSESIDGAGFRCPNRLGAARASVGRAMRLVAARRTTRGVHRGHGRRRKRMN